MIETYKTLAVARCACFRSESMVN